MSSDVETIRHEAIDLMRKGLHEQAEASLAAFNEHCFDERLVYLLSICQREQGAFLQSVRSLRRYGSVSPLLRRSEIAGICGLRSSQELIIVLERTFSEMRDHYMDFVFFSINELVFHRAFQDAQLVLSRSIEILNQDDNLRANKLELQEKIKYIAETEKSLRISMFESKYKFSKIVQRLGEVDTPVTTWKELLDNEAKVSSSICTYSDSFEENTGASSIYDGYQEVFCRNLPLAKPLQIIFLKEAYLIQGDGFNDICSHTGKIFPALCSRRSICNAGYMPLAQTSEYQRYQSAVILPAIDDPGYFNAILIGLFAVLLWKEHFSSMPIIIPDGYNKALYELAEYVRGENILVRQERKPCIEIQSAFVPFVEGRSLNAASIMLFKRLAAKWLIVSAVSNFDHLYVYVTRRSAGQRRLLNEAQLEESLVNLGFRILCFEEMTPIEQVQAVSDAEVLVAPHGAGLVNMLFSQRLKSVVELMPRNYQVRGFENLSRRMGVDYTCIIGDSISKGSMADLSWTIDIPRTISIIVGLIPRVAAG